MDGAVHAFVVQHLTGEVGAIRVQPEGELGHVVDPRIILTSQELGEETGLLSPIDGRDETLIHGEDHRLDHLDAHLRGGDGDGAGNVPGP